MVVIMPVVASTLLTRLLKSSEIIKLPFASHETPVGLFICAAAARPPSPEQPA